MCFDRGIVMCVTYTCVCVCVCVDGKHTLAYHTLAQNFGENDDGNTEKKQGNHQHDDQMPRTKCEAV